MYSCDSCWIGSKKLFSAAMNANTTPVEVCPLIASSPPTTRISTVTSADRSSTAGKYAALRLTVVMFARRLSWLSSSKRVTCLGSWPNERITRIPDSVSCR